MLRGTAASVGNARRLRRELTLPEGLLWRELRRRRIGYKFRKQHPAGPYALDFACLEARLVVEVDGEAHDRGTNPAHDEGRDEWLANQGYRTLRIPAREVLADLEAVVRFVLAQCRERCPRPNQPLHHPPAVGGPPPRTGEEL